MDDDAVGLPADRAGETLRPAAAEAACARALDVDVINVSKIESMLKNATENTPAAGLAAAASAGSAGSPGTRPSTPPRPAYGCRSWMAAATPPAAAGPDLPGRAGRQACARLPAGRRGAPSFHLPVYLSPGFLFIPFFSRAEKKRKALDMTDQMTDQGPLPARCRGGTARHAQCAALQAARMRHRTARCCRARRASPVLQPCVLTQMAQRHRPAVGSRPRRSGRPGRWPGCSSCSSMPPAWSPMQPPSWPPPIPAGSPRGWPPRTLPAARPRPRPPWPMPRPGSPGRQAAAAAAPSPARHPGRTGSR